MFKQARSIQLAWFFDGEAPPASKLAAAFFDGDPDNLNKLTPPQVPFPMTVQSVMREDVVYRVQSYFGRIDFFIERASFTPELNLISDPVSVLQDALQRVKVLAELVPVINRASIVVTLTEPMSDADAATAAFAQVLSRKVELEGARDLMFQASRRVSDTPHGPVNRLLRWWSESLSFVPVAQATVPHLTSAPEHHYVNFMMDVNTAQAPGVTFNQEQQPSVFLLLSDVTSDLLSIESMEDVN